MGDKVRRDNGSSADSSVLIEDYTTSAGFWTQSPRSPSQGKYTFRVATSPLWSTLWIGSRVGAVLLLVEFLVIELFHSLAGTEWVFEGGALFWIGLVMPFPLGVLLSFAFSFGTRLDVCASPYCLQRLPSGVTSCPACRAVICGRIKHFRDRFEAQKILDARLNQFLAETQRILATTNRPQRAELPEARVVKP